MVDKFGATSDSLGSDMIIRGRPGIGFKLTEDGDFDLGNKRLRNIAIPVEETDAISKKYYDHELTNVICSNHKRKY